MHERTLEKNKGIDYKQLFSIRYVDIGPRNGTWGFTVADNYTIFISSQPHPHSHIGDTQGVENENTLVEGYIEFNDQGKIRRVEIKPLYTRGTLVQQPREEQEKISEAIRNVIKEKLSRIQ